MDAKKNNEATEFQDIVYKHFKEEWGWNIIHHTNIEKQYKEGENNAGIEIKNDQQMRKYPNLFITISRKYYNGSVPSGIMKKHNKRFYVQGVAEKFYIFGLNDLIRYYNKNKLTLTHKTGYTTGGGGEEYGFLLPQETADKIAFEVYTKQKQLTLV